MKAAKYGNYESSSKETIQIINKDCLLLSGCWEQYMLKVTVVTGEHTQHGKEQKCLVWAGDGLWSTLVPKGATGTNHEECVVSLL